VAGLVHPVLMIAGLVWGIYSALNITAGEGEKRHTDDRLRAPEPVQTPVWS
jgi:hypothetical protein